MYYRRKRYTKNTNWCIGQDRLGQARPGQVGLREASSKNCNLYALLHIGTVGACLICLWLETTNKQQIMQHELMDGWMDGKPSWIEIESIRIETNDDSNERLRERTWWGHDQEVPDSSRQQLIVMLDTFALYLQIGPIKWTPWDCGRRLTHTQTHTQRHNQRHQEL